MKQERNSEMLRRTSVFGKIIFSFLLSGMILHGYGDDAAWQNWLGKLAGDISVDRANLIVEIMAALDQEHRVVTQPKTGMFNCDEHGIATAAELTEFAKKVGSWMNCAYTGIQAEYRADIKGVKLVSDRHDDFVMLGIGTDIIQNPALIKAQICLKMSSLTINWNMVCQDKPKEWQQLAIELMAICQGFGEVLLSSIETRKTVNGSSVTYHSTSWLRLKATEIAWAIGALDTFRGRDLQICVNTDLGKIAKERGLTSVRLNTKRICDLMKIYKNAIEDAKKVVIPAGIMPWRSMTPPEIKKPISAGDELNSSKPSKKSVARINGGGNYKVSLWYGKLQRHSKYVPPKDEVFDIARQEVKNELAEKNGGRMVRQAAIDELAYARLSLDESRYFYFRNQFSELTKKKQWNKAELILKDMINGGHCDLALAAVDDVELGKSQCREATALQKRLDAIRNAREAVRKYEQGDCNLITKEQHEIAAQAYLTLNEDSNAVIALKCADPQREDMMDATSKGSIYQGGKFEWLMPKTMEVANFWCTYGTDKDVYVQSACMRIAALWYEKALKRYNLKNRHEPSWVLLAKQRLETCKQYDLGIRYKVLKPELSISMADISRECRVPVVQKTTGGNRVVATEIDVSRTTQIGGFTSYQETEKWFCPRTWWLANAGARTWQYFDRSSGCSIVITVIRTNVSLPLSDADFDNSKSKCPRAENLLKGFHETEVANINDEGRVKWIAKYYDVMESEVKLKQLLSENGRIAYLTTLNNESCYGLWVQFGSHSGVFADFSVIGNGKIKESFFLSYAKRVSTKL